MNDIQLKENIHYSSLFDGFFFYEVVFLQLGQGDSISNVIYGCSLSGKKGHMYEATIDDIGYRLVAVYTPVREDGMEGDPVSASIGPIAVGVLHTPFPLYS